MTIRFMDLLKRLHDHDEEFVVIGGVAATLDVDVCAPMPVDNLLTIHAGSRREDVGRFR